MMMGRFVCRQKVSAAHPEPSALAAVCENSFLNRSQEPYSSSMTLAMEPEGFPPPPELAGGKVLPEQRVEYVPPDLERELLECRLRIEIRVVGPSLVHLLENGVGRVHVGRVVLIVVQPQQVRREMRRQRGVVVRKFWQSIQFRAFHLRCLPWDCLSYGRVIQAAGFTSIRLMISVAFSSVSRMRKPRRSSSGCW